MKYVIIGASAAGVSAAKAIVEQDKSSEVILVSIDEKIYSRCMIHYVIAGKRDIDSINFIDKDFFNNNAVKWIKGMKVTDINFSSNEIILEDNSRLSYDKLLIAAGSNAVIPPIKGFEGAENVFKLRDIDDIIGITEAAAHSDRAIVLGAGLIGVDAASALIEKGLKVTIIEMADRLLPLQLDHESAANYQKLFESKGAEIYTGVSVTEAVKDSNGKVKSVILSNGTIIDCDMIVTAVGVRPNLQFIKQGDLEIDRGIKVNDRMQTSVENVFAAGDITGQSAIWPSAVKQGIVAASNMIGKEEHYTDLFTAKNAVSLFGLGTISIGTPIAPDESYTVAIFDKDGVYKKIIYKDGIVYGVILQKDVSRSGFWTKVIKDKIKIDTSVDNIFNANYADFFSIDNRGSFGFAS